MVGRCCEAGDALDAEGVGVNGSSMWNWGSVWKSGDVGFVSGVGWVWGIFKDNLDVKDWRR